MPIWHFNWNEVRCVLKKKKRNKLTKKYNQIEGKTKKAFINRFQEEVLLISTDCLSVCLLSIESVLKPITLSKWLTKACFFYKKVRSFSIFEEEKKQLFKIYIRQRWHSETVFKYWSFIGAYLEKLIHSKNMQIFAQFINHLLFVFFALSVECLFIVCGLD